MKILFTDLAYLTHNYGAQGILLPLLDYFQKKKYEISVTVSSKHNFDKDKEIAKSHGFNLYVKPRLNFSTLLHPKKIIELMKYSQLIKDHDAIIDISGIEFIGNLPKIILFKDFINTILTQIIAQKKKKLYLKYSKSYGPFVNPIHTMLSKYFLNKLPFILVRGEFNLKNLERLNLSLPICSFPDVSLMLEPVKRKWAEEFLHHKFDIKPQQLIGISPSIVISKLTGNSNNCAGENHILLVNKLIRHFSKSHKVILLPHSINDGVNINQCDLALSKKIYQKFLDNDNVLLVDNMELTYREVRTIIGLFDFYITSRYHSLASALKMKTPVVSLSWHIKYKDLMKMYLSDYLVINSRTTDQVKAFQQILISYSNRELFDRKKIAANQKEIERKIIESLEKINSKILEL